MDGQSEEADFGHLTAIFCQLLTASMKDHVTPSISDNCRIWWSVFTYHSARQGNVSSAFNPYVTWCHSQGPLIQVTEWLAPPSLLHSKTCLGVVSPWWGSWRLSSLKRPKQMCLWTARSHSFLHSITKFNLNSTAARFPQWPAGLLTSLSGWQPSYKLQLQGSPSQLEGKKAVTGDGNVLQLY